MNQENNLNQSNFNIEVNNNINNNQSINNNGSKNINVALIIVGVIAIIVGIILAIIISKNVSNDKNVGDGQLDVVPDDYIAIETVDDYVKLLDGTYSLKKNYILMNDLDLDEYCKDNKCRPIGIDSDDGFSGIFDGNYHTISNYSFSVNTDSDEYVGFFSTVNKGMIKNLNLDNAEITISTFKAYGFSAGLLVGTASNSLIENCEVNGSIKTKGTIESGVGTVGLLVGHLTGYDQNSSIEDKILENTYAGYHVVSVIRNSVASGTIDLKTNGRAESIGGLVGRTTSSDYGSVAMYNLVEKSSASVGVKVSSSKNEINMVGGLIGTSDIDHIYECSSSGDVDAYDGLSVGGFIGLSSMSKVEESYSTGNVRGGAGVAGFISSYNNSTGIEFMGVYNSYSTGDVTVASDDSFVIPSNSSGVCECASFINLADDVVENCYSSGNIIYSGSKVNYGKPFILEGRTNLESTYYNGDLIDYVNEDYKYVKLVSDDMLKKSSYPSFNFDNVWSIDEGTSMPYLKWQNKEKID